MQGFFLWLSLCTNPELGMFSKCTSENSGCGLGWHKQGFVDLMKAAFKDNKHRENSLYPQKTAYKPRQKQQCTVAEMFTYAHVCAQTHL
jgi:hypothetical protein